MAKSRKKSRSPSSNIIVLIFLTLVLGVLVMVIRLQQNINEKATATPVPQFCPEAGACPFFNPVHGDNGQLLRDCYPPQSDNTPKDSSCYIAGRTAPCGPDHTIYCCPSAGGVWTTDMTVCNSLAPTPSPSPSPTPSPNSCPNPNLVNPWDVDQNGVVNIVDIGIVIDNYNKDACLNPKADVNNDGVVSIVDIGLIIDHYNY